MENFVKWLLYIFFRKNTSAEHLSSQSKKRKKPDTTKLTQYHYDFINESYTAWKAHNEGLPRKDRIPISALCRSINHQLGLDKSQRALGRVWNGEINRDDLPVGTLTYVTNTD